MISGSGSARSMLRAARIRRWLNSSNARARALRRRWMMTSTLPRRWPRSMISCAKSLLALVARFDAVFGIFGEVKQEMLDSEIQALIDERQAARKAKNFARSDE